MNRKEKLIIGAASKVHEDWCLQELFAFYTSAKEIWIRDKLSIEKSLQKACFKSGVKRNEVLLHVHGEDLIDCLDSFKQFISFLEIGVVEVRRWVKRDLTLDEQLKASYNYNEKTFEENILRPFVRLSQASKKENLEAAIGAFNVYEEMAKAGVSISQMEQDLEIRNLIGIAIHLNWVKRNVDNSNDNLKVPYNQLDEWTKNQDLTVFGALLGIIKQDVNKYAVSRQNGYEIPDYIKMEQEFFHSVNVKKELKRTK